MGKLNRCTCGRMPVIRARITADRLISTQATCPRIECGAQGPEYLDHEHNAEGAARLWNRDGGRKAA